MHVPIIVIFCIVSVYLTGRFGPHPSEMAYIEKYYRTAAVHFIYFAYGFMLSMAATIAISVAYLLYMLTMVGH